MIDFKYSMRCRGCGQEFGARRSSALFCSGNCRTKWHNKHKQSKNDLITAQQSRVMTKSLRTKIVTCAGCDAKFIVNGNNSMRKYHSNACKAKAYRFRCSIVKELTGRTVRK